MGIISKIKRTVIKEKIIIAENQYNFKGLRML